VPYPFLSDEWIREAHAIYERHGEHIGELLPARINQTVTDVPFGEGQLQAHVDTTSGTLELDLGHLDDAKVSITIDYDTARSLFVDQDPGAAMQAFLAGKIVVQGDMTELLKLQAALQMEALQGAGEEIRAITA